MSLKKFSFNVIKNDGFARLGKIETHRGFIDTPVFMPVGTQATIKGAFINDIVKTGAQIILSNTYHLMIRPGVERIKSQGGLHQYMNCNLPILTDFFLPIFHSFVIGIFVLKFHTINFILI